MKRKKEQQERFPKVQPEDLLAAKERVYERAMQTRSERDAACLVGRVDIMGVFGMAHHALVANILANASVEDVLEQVSAAAIYVLASMTVAREHNERTGRIQIVKPGEGGVPE
jgi:hypothetical protein